MQKGQTKGETETAPGASGQGTQQDESCDGQSCLGQIPHVQSKVTRMLHAHDGKYLHWYLLRVGRYCCQASLRPGKKGAMALGECQGLVPFDTIETSV